jgi:DNA-binding MarR family transcriptional regulator
MTRASTADLRGLREVFEEAGLLHHRLRASMKPAFRRNRLPGGMRDVLRDLDRLGPLTVPQLAHQRSVTRQHVQMVVVALVRRRLVVMKSNPAHRRSRFAALTTSARALLRAMRRDEDRLLADLPVAIPAPRLRRTAATLRALRRAFEDAAPARRPAAPPP